MEIANIVLRLMAASQVLLFICMLLMSSNPMRIRLLGAVLMAGVVGYLFAPLYTGYIGDCCASIFWYPASIVPSLLLLFVWVLFEEHEPIPLWLIVVVVVSLILSLSAHLAFVGVIEAPYLKLISQYLKVVLVVTSLIVVWRGREADLVELRFKFRSLFVVIVAMIVLSIILVELFTGFLVPQTVEIVGMSIIAVCAFVFNLYFVRKNPATRLVSPPVIARDEGDDEVIKTLLSRMRSERLYADHDVRVASLADTLNVAEYQLRKRINQQLGYRNFNQFINRYRIEEAGVRLLENMKTPVLTIALDVGFRSISSFNTAFLTHFGVSPTQYRAQSQIST